MSDGLGCLAREHLRIPLAPFPSPIATLPSSQTLQCLSSQIISRAARHGGMAPAHGPFIFGKEASQAIFRFVCGRTERWPCQARGLLPAALRAGAGLSQRDG